MAKAGPVCSRATAPTRTYTPAPIVEPTPDHHVPMSNSFAKQFTCVHWKLKYYKNKHTNIGYPYIRKK